MKNPAVEVTNLTKIFQTSALSANVFRRGAFGVNYVLAVNNLSLTVGQGEVYGLIGPNGSGKSTTMKVVLGLMAPTTGTAKVFGLDSGDLEARREIGYLPENPYFYRHLTGEETLRFYGKLCGLRGRALSARIGELLELVDLVDARNRRLAGYSKGMLQRIGLAQALVQKPRLVILDEPTAGVDPLGSRQIRDLILRLKQEGISIFLCSHLLEQVQEVCDRVGIIARGTMKKEGTLEDLVSVENRYSLVLENASPQLIKKLHQMIQQEKGTSVVEEGKPRTSLERLFIQITGDHPDDNSKESPK